MAASKLYPTLSRFYEGSYIGFGSELDNLLVNLAERNQHSKDSQSALISNNVNAININKSHVDKHSSDMRDTNPVLPRLSENTSNNTDNDQAGQQDSQQVVPSAPPIELFDEELLQFLENAINDQNFSPTLDDTPAADYTNLTIQTNIVFDETWVDDLQPDYDLTLEEVEADLLNNLNKSDVKISKDKHLDVGNNSDHSPHSTQLNIFPEHKKSKDSHTKDSAKYHKVHEKHLENITEIAHKSGHVRLHEDVLDRQRNGADAETTRPSPGSPEYNAWMTWRKQVNRQLATVIFLRRGGHVKLQKGDLSRKHLNQKSIDFVSKVVKSDNKTSLGAKPFVMYGIPRACLSAGHRDSN